VSLRVVSPGPFTLPVGAGRPGWRALGVPVGGPADRDAFALANALVGNPPDAVALELTLAGPTLTADAPTGCVVFGAPFDLGIPGREPPTVGTTFTLNVGETLLVGGTPRGVRGYFAVVGGFDFPTVLGSRSAFEPLKLGDVLTCPASTLRGRALPFADLIPTADPVELRVLPGSQAHWFPPGELLTRTYTVTAASNRMGVRLAGDPLPRVPAYSSAEMASEPVAPGAVQVTNDGRPIVLGVDGQTIGGYPRPAHVIRADLGALAQLRPGRAVRFREVTPDEAEAVARQAAGTLAGWGRRLAWFR
jgi:biotin-dependent carboxylase-like uncharacterized protein